MICIGIAFIFWLVTKMSYEYKSTVSVKAIYHLPEGKIFTFPPPSDIEVELKGTGWDLLGIHSQSKPPTIEMEVDEEQSQKNATLSLESRIYKLFPKATVLDIRPNTIQLNIEESASKTIPIFIDHQIELAALHGFVDSIVIRPQKVQITGPASVVRDIKAWHTVPVILQNVKTTVSQEVALQKHPNGNVFFEPSSLLLEAKVEALTEKKLEVPILVRYTGDSSVHVTILPKKIEVACMVVLSKYEELRAENFEAFVEFKKEPSLSSEGLRVRLSAPPPFVSQVHYYPRTVDYIVRERSEND